RGANRAANRHVRLKPRHRSSMGVGQHDGFEVPLPVTLRHIIWAFRILRIKNVLTRRVAVAPGRIGTCPDKTVQAGTRENVPPLLPADAGLPLDAPRGFEQPCSSARSLT